MSDQPEVGNDMEEEKAAKAPSGKELKKALEESKKKAAEYYDQLLRLRAEFDNFRKRGEREKLEARAWGKQEVLLELISLVDIFEQALEHAHKAKDLKDVVSGVEMLHKSFAQFLKTEGLQPILTEGQTFNPLWSEAIEQEEVDGEKVGQVLSELQKGYLFQGRILRPSRVRVGVARKTDQEEPAKPAEPTEFNNDEQE
jgi:molecular chaperone GrpE